MPFPVSERVSKMQGSATLIAAQMASELKSQGHEIIDLSIGEPDFETPDFVQEFAREGLAKGLTKYTPSAGTQAFKESVCRFFERRFGTHFAASEVAASCGGKQGLFNAACTLLNPGDEVLIPKPYWVTFPEIATFCQANSSYIETAETDFVLTADQVRDSINNKTKLLIINSPNNPTGRVIPPDEMRKIVEVCAEREVYVLTDECYLFFAYPPAEVFTSASLTKELREYVCVAGSFSKTFAMTGWRIGFTIANETWTKEMVKLQSHSATHPTSFVQYACAKGVERYDETIEAVTTMTAEYERRKNWLIPALNEIDGFECAMPEGAFYAFVDVRGMLGGEFATSGQIADALLRRSHLVVTDGAPFGAEGYIRISYATSMGNLKKAIAAMQELFGAARVRTV